MTPKAPKSRPDTDTKYLPASLYFPAGLGKNIHLEWELLKAIGSRTHKCLCPGVFVPHAVGKGKSVGKGVDFSIYEFLLQKIEVRDRQVCEHISRRINVLVG